MTKLTQKQINRQNQSLNNYLQEIEDIFLTKKSVLKSMFLLILIPFKTL